VDRLSWKQLLQQASALVCVDLFKGISSVLLLTHTPLLLRTALLSSYRLSWKQQQPQAAVWSVWTCQMVLDA
jgi:hypothetical protein